MSKLSKYFAIIASAALIGLNVQSAIGENNDPIWLNALEKQIYNEMACDPNYFLNLQEYVLGNDKVYEAKVVCVDGRQFDATRTGELAPFVIRACQPVVC